MNSLGLIFVFCLFGAGVLAQDRLADLSKPVVIEAHSTVCASRAALEQYRTAVQQDAYHRIAALPCWTFDEDKRVVNPRRFGWDAQVTLRAPDGRTVALWVLLVALRNDGR